MNKTVTYIVEGQTEEAFLNNLKAHSIINTGRVKVFNLMQKKMKATNPILHLQRDEIVCIIDTDCCNITNLENLLVNLALVKKVANTVVLWIQNKNLEDELMFILSCNLSGLCSKLNVKNVSIKDLKECIAKSKVDFSRYITSNNIDKYCSRPKDFIKEMQNCGKNIPGKIKVYKY